MNIIEAIQNAEQGKLITNNFLKTTNCYLEYSGEGVFMKHMIIGDEKTTFVGECNEFTMASILSNGWELIRELKLPK